MTQLTCPKCLKSDSIALVNDNKYSYCPSCNYSWDAGNKNTAEGSLSFDGIAETKKIIDYIADQQMLLGEPLNRATIETLLTSALYEQFFLGFKTGQLASITYAKDFYGKNRNDSSATDNAGAHGTKVSTDTESRSVVGENRRRSRSNDPADPRAATDHSSITTRVGGRALTHPRHIILNESIFTEVAVIVEQLKHWYDKLSFNYDGIKLTVNIDGV